MRDNTTGVSNTALGRVALRSNTTGGGNNAIGYHALETNTTANGNNAMGRVRCAITLQVQATLQSVTPPCRTTPQHPTTQRLGISLHNATTATGLVLIGRGWQGTTTGSENTALGYDAMQKTTTGGYNVGLGFRALFSNTTASYNMVGYKAGCTTTGTQTRS